MDAIDTHLDLVFMVGESLFPMMLVPFRATNSLEICFPGASSAASGSDWFVS